MSEQTYHPCTNSLHGCSSVGYGCVGVLCADSAVPFRVLLAFSIPFHSVPFRILLTTHKFLYLMTTRCITNLNYDLYLFGCRQTLHAAKALRFAYNMATLFNNCPSTTFVGDDCWIMWSCYGVRISECMALFVCVLCQPVHSCIEPSLQQLGFFL